ncbi:MAG: inositol monophosphatase [Deltaproteobacteria bacterium]|nr:inositol monophosphatase [Deltaproteobacteria bacterium]
MALPPGDDGAERDLAERLAAAVTIAEDAGRCLLAHLGRLDGVDQKGRGDLVSAADRAAEELIVAALASRFPTDRVVAEEGHDRAGSAAPGGPTWYVDPLDGTTNFVHGLPVFCVSLGLVAGGEPVLGVVHMPALGRTYRAARGGGAWLGERRLRVSAATRLDDALLATGFPYNRYDTAAELLRPVERALRVARGVRRMGAAAADLAFVAEGALSGYWEPRLKPWDLAAGLALVREAGGVATDFEGHRDVLAACDVVAAGPALHPALLRLVRGDA